ncbi:MULTISPECIES: ArsR/SmtB family transcription factor [unclassified Microbacterium]|uniref:ArsR/SmtB family transcription factor n=1 Tax=unclassified Microbacterium TaxID=2609290 RepID=UPI00301B48E4
MPKYATLPDPLPHGARKAMDMFGANAMRGAIIRTLSAHPHGLTSGQIERELNASYQTVFRHLKALVAEGAVLVDEQVNQGRRTIYTLDREAVDRALTDYRHYLFDAE